jgi:hypothetical protein
MLVRLFLVEYSRYIPRAETRRRTLPVAILMRRGSMDKIRGAGRLPEKITDHEGRCGPGGSGRFPL